MAWTGVLGGLSRSVGLLCAQTGGASASSEGGAAAGPHFQPYIFWAYGLACAVLLAFTVMTLLKARHLEERLRYLEERFKGAHPEESDPE